MCACAYRSRGSRVSLAIRCLAWLNRPSHQHEQPGIEGAAIGSGGSFGFLVEVFGDAEIELDQSAPGFAEQCRQLTEARRENEWLRAGSVDVQQQALKDFAKAKAAKFTSGFGEPTWRKKYRHEGFRVIGTDRVPEVNEDGSARLNPKTGKQAMGRSVVVQKLNRRWALVKIPPKAKTFRVTYKTTSGTSRSLLFPSRLRHQVQGRSLASTGASPSPPRCRMGEGSTARS